MKVMKLMRVIIDQNLSKLNQDEFIMNNLDDEYQAKQIVDCYLQLKSGADAYDLMRLLEDEYGWNGSLKNCLFLAYVLTVLEG